MNKVINNLFSNKKEANTSIVNFVNSTGNVNFMDENDTSLLIFAIDYKYHFVIRFLIDQGADINHINKFGITPLEMSIIAGNIEITKELFEKKAYFDTSAGLTPIHIAAANGNIELVEYFLKYYDIDHKDERLCTSLYYAVQENKIEAVKYLIMKGANVNYSDENGYNLLLCAVGEGYEELVNYLLTNFSTFFKNKINEAIVLAHAHGKIEIEAILSKYN